MEPYRYFMAEWTETTGQPLTDDWGIMDYYFEVDEAGFAIRKIEVFANGKVLKYSTTYKEDKWGGLPLVRVHTPEAPLDPISKDDFEYHWAKPSVNDLR